MEPTLSEKNYWLSVTKFFVDMLETDMGIHLKFGPGLSSVPDDWNEWVAISGGRSLVGGLSTAVLNIFPCVRKDPGGVGLATLTDRVFEAITDYGNPERFPTREFWLYDTDTDPWTELVGIMVNPQSNPVRGEPMEAPDGSVFRMIVAETKYFTS